MKTSFVQRVKHAIYHAPYMIPALTKENAKMTHYILYQLFNRSCGIEIECFGSLIKEFLISNSRYILTRETKTNILTYYNIQDYWEDCLGRDSVHEPSISLSSTEDFIQQSYEGNYVNEHRIRISGYKQLIGLYEILNDLKKYCLLNPLSGIHIHVDISEYSNLMSMGLRNKLAVQLEKKLDNIEKIFYPKANTRYTGTFNKKQIDVDGEMCRHGWVSIRERYGTIEYRIGPMSFEYDDIVSWCIGLNQITNTVVNKLRLPIRYNYLQRRPSKKNSKAC